MPAIQGAKVTGKSARIVSLDFFRGFILVVMILNHSAGWYGLNKEGVGFFIYYFPHCGLAGFIALVGAMVGFHYLPSINDAASARKTARRLLWRAAQMLLIVYAFSISYYLVFREPGGVNATTPDSVRSFSALLELLVLKRINHRIGILILIGFLMLVSIGVVWLRRLFRNWFAALGVGAAIYLAYYFLVQTVPAPDENYLLFFLPKFLIYWDFSIMAYSLFYFGGIAVGVLIHKAVQNDRFPAMAQTITAAGVGSVAVWGVMAYVISSQAGRFAFPVYFRDPAQPYFVVFAISFSLLCLGLIMLAEKSLKGLRGLQWVETFGRHSLFVFVFQWWVIAFVFRGLEKTHAPDYLRWAMIPFTIALTAVATHYEGILLAKWKAYRNKRALGGALQS